MGDVVDFNGVTTLDTPVETVLMNALDADLNEVVIIAVDSEGDLRIASHTSNTSEVLFLMEMAKHEFLNMVRPSDND